MQAIVQEPVVVLGDGAKRLLADLLRNKPRPSTFDPILWRMVLSAEVSLLSSAEVGQLADLVPDLVQRLRTADAWLSLV